MIHYFSLVRIINSSEVCFYTFAPHPLSASFVTFENICQKMKVGRKLLFPPTRISIFCIFVHTSMIFKLKEKQYG